MSCAWFHFSIPQSSNSSSDGLQLFCASFGTNESGSFSQCLFHPQLSAIATCPLHRKRLSPCSCHTALVIESCCLICSTRLHEESALFSWVSLRLRQALCSWNVRWSFFSASASLPWQPNSALHLQFILEAGVFCSPLVVVNQGLGSRLLSYSSTGIGVFSSTLFPATMVLFAPCVTMSPSCPQGLKAFYSYKRRD